MFANLPVNAMMDGNVDLESLSDHIEELLLCPWFVDKEGYLYILDMCGDEKVHGPEAEEWQENIADALVLCAGIPCGDCSEWDVAECASEKSGECVAYVPDHLHRFDSVLGFYHA